MSEVIQRCLTIEAGERDPQKKILSKLKQNNKVSLFAEQISSQFWPETLPPTKGKLKQAGDQSLSKLGACFVEHTLTTDIWGLEKGIRNF